MIERTRRLDVPQAALAAFAIAGAAAFAWGRADPRAWLVLLAFPPALAFHLTALPARGREAVEKVAWLALTALATTVLYWLASPLGQGQPAPPLPAPAAYSAPLLSAFFLAGLAVWPASRALVPSVLVTAVIGASQARSARPMGAALAAVTLTGLIVLVSDGGAGPAAARLRRLARLVGFVGLAAALALGISMLLPWVQPQVVQYAARAAFPEASSGFSPEANLGGVEELSLSSEVVMRVWSNAPRKLRAWVATRFDGKSWQAAAGRVRNVAPSDGTPPADLTAWLGDVSGTTFLIPASGKTSEPPARPSVAAERTKILLVLAVPGAIPASAGVVAVRAPATRLTVSETELLGPPLPAGSVYALLGGAPPTRDSSGRDAAETPGPESLALPDDTDARLVALAGELASGTTTSAERLERTLGYLQTRLRYSLRVGRLQSRQPVAEFVFEKKRGWCQYFASAAAVLLRLQGVPTRYVSGFQLRDRLFRGGHYVVRQADAHAWIEAWLPGRGWIEADPTPASGYDEAHGGLGAGWLEGAGQWLRGLGGRLSAVDWKAVPRVLWNEAAGWIDRAPARAATGAALVLVGLVAFLRTRRWLRALRRRPSVAPRNPGDVLAPLLARLDHAWSTHGSPRPPSRAPLEHLRQLDPDRVPRTLLDVGRGVVEAYYRVRFAGAAVDADELRALDASLRRLRSRSGAS